MNNVVSVAACNTYELDQVRQAVVTCLEPLGGIAAFVHPGMHVLLKPNLLLAKQSLLTRAWFKR